MKQEVFSHTQTVPIVQPAATSLCRPELQQRSPAEDLTSPPTPRCTDTWTQWHSDNMGSRVRQNPERAFNVFFEATCPIASEKDPVVRLQFPDDFRDEESCQTLSRFCFPYDMQGVREETAVQHFTFVLTDIEGCQRFGFCRVNNSSQMCLCILSYLPWFEVFYKFLNTLADCITKDQIDEMKVMLATLYKQPIPLTAGSITLQMAPYFIAPDPIGLPSIPENVSICDQTWRLKFYLLCLHLCVFVSVHQRNLTELVVAVDVTNLLQLYASMLFERRILIFARKLNTLTSCVHALGALLYPMHWQHIFIPVLPPHLLDYCCAPMPYLIGVHSSLAEKVRSRGLEEVVILNVDTNTLETPFNDLKKIPSDVSGLKVCLKRQVVSAGCGVSRAFLKAQSVLFGGYKDALQNHKGGEVSFSNDVFLDHKSASMRGFLQSAIHLQFFKQFIDGRLDILNTGKVPQDLFEEEILQCETTGKSKSYLQIVGNLKRGGGALILNIKSKTNNAKGLTSSGLKSRLKHKAFSQTQTLQRGGSLSHRAQSDCLQNRLPITQHFGMSRPRRPSNKLGVTQGQGAKAAGDAWSGAMPGQGAMPDSEFKTDEEKEEEELCDLEEMDLLSEIFDTLSIRSSHDRGLLYGTRSLDLFGPDSHDYITKLGRVNPSQESLSLCTSGSGSLNSWKLEQSENVQTLTGTSDGLSFDAYATVKDTSAFVTEQEKILRGVGDQQLKRKEAIDVNHKVEIHSRNSSKEVTTEPERTVTSKRNPVEETAERHEDKDLEKTEDGLNPGESEKQCRENKTDEVQKDVTEERSGMLMMKSAEVGFHSHESREGFLEKSRNNDLAESDRAGNSSDIVQTYQSYNSRTHSDANSTSENEQGGPTPLKVSELKKMFESQWSSHTG
ncbi:DENN domain-containing protein 1B isoform X3 [Hippocampus zosterae]|uniref:DENN domain-containing protein 1B isoform X3 n=1 Tax=Hippocampus zosterae TaxID=109293 RepID=UPI00223D290A|nr:DENN domain-containing protein 1B isoform X3 [Hippocampus zosterae]